MKKKQKYNFKGRPDRACSIDELRPAMNYILIDEGNMIATDGQILVKIPLSLGGLIGDVSQLHGWLIHKNQYTEMLRYDILRVTGPGEITGIKGKGASFKTVFKLRNDLQFVNYKHVLDFEPESIPKIGVQARLLSKLISCFEGIDDLTGFKMEFQKPTRAIHFHSTGQDKSFGLLMPYMLSDYL